MSDTSPATAHPAATVVLLRDSNDGCELLLVRRNTRLDFHGGAWVFPGGRLDQRDYVVGGSSEVVEAARQAAVREAREEAGVVIAPEQLVLVSRWITPEFLPKRFDTWFFAAPANDAAVHIDGGEIQAHCWLRPEQALAAQRRGEIELPPPTFVTVQRLSGFHAANDALADLARGPLETFVPRIYALPDGACSLYEGDTGYADGDVDRPGPRHRLLMVESGWRYERID